MDYLKDVIAQLKEYGPPAVTEMKPGKTEGPGKLTNIRFKVEYDLEKFAEEFPKEVEKWSKRENSVYWATVAANEVTEGLLNEFLDLYGMKIYSGSAGDFEIQTVDEDPVDINLSNAEILEMDIEDHLGSFDFVKNVKFRHVYGN